MTTITFGKMFTIFKIFVDSRQRSLVLRITRSVASRWMLTLFVRGIVTAPGDVQVTLANERPTFAPSDQSEPSVDNNKDISTVWSQTGTFQIVS